MTQVCPVNAHGTPAIRSHGFFERIRGQGGRSGRSHVAVHVARCAGDGDRLPPSSISPTRRAHGPGQIHSPKPMAWRPYENLIDGELDNRTPGKVTGWMRFFRNGKQPLRVTFDLEGDFHEDICGAKIRLSNSQPSDHHEGRDTYMEGFSEVQQGTVGDMTSGRSLGQWSEQIAQQLMMRNEIAWDDFGLHGAERERRRKEFFDRYQAHIAKGDLYYPYSSYPYLEWYSDNGRVVLELDQSQVEIVETSRPKAKAPAELYREAKKRDEAMMTFMGELAQNFSEDNHEDGGGDVTGVVIN